HFYSAVDRERREDIPDLVHFFLANHDFSRRIAKRVGAAALSALVSYAWPGNVRELKNVVERAIIMSGEAAEIGPEHLGPLDDKPACASVVAFSFDHEPTLEELKKAYVAQLHDRHAGHRANIAKALGASERNTYRLIKRYGLEG
ncbi:MAG: sigma-54-dependent Fis family transcriptional regulator, partial [Alphaproteobacteria bacterium]|nr:sigma-54-dependent Fis family transcriptional regulator [Alphaproteobacteria bacterium]